MKHYLNRLFEDFDDDVMLFIVLALIVVLWFFIRDHAAQKATAVLDDDGDNCLAPSGHESEPRA